MRLASLYFLALLFVVSAANAQQRPIFDPDDFLDPRERESSIFATRMVVGGVVNRIDDYRPRHGDDVFVHITNSLYVSNFQFDYKHTSTFGDTPRTSVCCPIHPIYFPTPPLSNATPSAPPPGHRETLQFGWYHTRDSGALRYRLTWSWQPIDTDLHSVGTGEIVERRSGREQSFGLDADTSFRIGGREIFGSLQFARTNRTGTIDKRPQNEIAYTNRFPGWAVGDVLMRATVTVGGISGRGANGINLLNPAFEAFYHHHGTHANVHLIYSPQATKSGLEGWKTQHQVAFFVDHVLWIGPVRK